MVSHLALVLPLLILGEQAPLALDLQQRGVLGAERSLS
jgi:hypothetical protein